MVVVVMVPSDFFVSSSLFITREEKKKACSVSLDKQFCHRFENLVKYLSPINCGKTVMFCTNNYVHILFSLSKNLWQADSFFSLPPLVVLVSSFSCPVRNYYHCTRPVLAVLGNLDLFLVSSNVYDFGWISPPSLFRRKKKVSKNLESNTKQHHLNVSSSILQKEYMCVF